MNFEEEEEVFSFYFSEKYFGNFIKNFEYFRREGSYSDVMFKVGQKSFFCYKIILVVGLFYFKFMFEFGMEESRKFCIEMKEVDENVFEKIFYFIYIGKVEIIFCILQEFFGQFCMFQVTALVDLCVRYFRLYMIENNCLVAFILVDFYVYKDLYNYAKEYVCMNFGVVF